MSAARDVVVLIGSLRKESWSRKVAKAMIELAPTALRCEIVELGALPSYNEDDEASPPAAWTTFRERLRPADAVLFVTPEYNRSVPGLLKNAIDVGSRPPKQSVWSRKAAGVVSVTPYKLGAFGANHHLRQSFVFLDMHALAQPEAYISGADKLFDATGKLSSAETREFLGKYMTAFAAWIERNAKQKPQ